MRARVAELKGKRESERKELVEEKLMQLWRAECDELRKANSMILVKTVANARKAQLEEKKVYAVQALKGKYLSGL